MTTRHTPIQIGVYDRSGRRTHMTPGDVCAGCSDRHTGHWVPVSQCPQAMATLKTMEIEWGWA